MPWPHVFSALQTALMSYLDDNFNAAAQLGTAVNFSAVGNTTPGTGAFTSLSATGATTLSGVTAVDIVVTRTDSNCVVATVDYVSGGGVCFYGIVESTTANLTTWQYGSTAVGSITTNGSGTAYNTASDAALKALHGPGDGTTLSVLPVRDASFLANPAVRHPMIIAQECAAVAPWAVRPAPEGSTAPWMIDHSALVPALLAYVQALEARVKALEAKAAVPAPAVSVACAAAMSAVAAATASAVVQAAIARGASVAGGTVGKAVVSSTPSSPQV